MGGCTDGWMSDCRWMSGWVEGSVAGWMERLVERWTIRKVDIRMYNVFIMCQALC